MPHALGSQAQHKDGQEPGMESLIAEILEEIPNSSSYAKQIVQEHMHTKLKPQYGPCTRQVMPPQAAKGLIGKYEDHE